MQLGSELEAHQFSCMISNLVRKHSTGEKPRCVICMEEVDNNDPHESIGGGDSSFLAICGHNFHQMCIRKWAVEFLKRQLNDEMVTERIKFHFLALRVERRTPFGFECSVGWDFEIEVSGDLVTYPSKPRPPARPPRSPAHIETRSCPSCFAFHCNTRV